MLSPDTLIAGRYRVVSRVGTEGTMGEVYRAVDPLGRPVAVKLLGPPTAQARREASVVAGLHHPFIVRTYDVLEWDGRLCLIQEWVGGPSLATMLGANESLGLAETVRMGIDVASALLYAHQHQVLHRDLKPSNVLRDPRGGYKLMDFGAVGLLESESQQTRSGEVAGTPLYMSPEQAVGTPQTRASDVYGLGLLLYRSLYGTVPGESAENFFALLTSRVSTPIDVPPSPLQDLIQRCLAIDPEQRPQSVEEVLDELRRAALEITGAQPGFGQRPTPVEPPGGLTPDTAPPRQYEHASRYVGTARSTPALSLAIIVGLMLAGLLVWLVAADPGLWLPVAAGLVIAGVGLLVARWVRRLAGKHPEAERQATSILTGAGDREALTRSMVLEVDQVVAKLKGLDAKILGYTMVMLIQEAEQAKESADRVAALVQMVTLMEKLTKQLSPWHVRHKEAIATSIAIVGSLVGVASAVSGFLR